MFSTWLLLTLGIAAWATCSIVNRFWYVRMFATTDYPAGMAQQRDLLVGMGPFGLFMLALFAGASFQLERCSALAARYNRTNTFVLIICAILIPRIGSGIANHIWYGRIFGDRFVSNQQRDLFVMMGLVGSFMLLLCTLVKFCIEGRCNKFASTTAP